MLAVLRPSVVRGALLAAGGALSFAAVGCGTASNATTPGGSSNGGDTLVTDEQMEALRKLSPQSLPTPPADASNKYADDAGAAALGQRLFFATLFAGPLLDSDNDGTGGSLGKVGEAGKVGCASCHVPGSGFSDTRSFQLQISLGAGWGRRRAPSLLDVGQAKLVLWDGRRDTLYNQIFGPLESVVEMNSSRLFMAQQIYAQMRAEYESVFGEMPPLADTQRFPALTADKTGCVPNNPTNPNPQCDGPFHGYPGDGAEFDGMTAEDQSAVTRVVVNAGKALGAYERLLSCGTSAFDAWMRGDKSAISPAAQRGAALFVGKAQCADCHSGPFMTDQDFHNVGLAPEIVQQAFIDMNDHGAATGIASALEDPLSSKGEFSDGDDGRLPGAVDPKLEGAFKTPDLRCVSKRPTFMHTGQIPTLAKVIDFFDKGGVGSGYPGQREIAPLGLTTAEKSDLLAFLLALDGPGPGAQYLQAPQ